MIRALVILALCLTSASLHAQPATLTPPTMPNNPEAWGFWHNGSQPEEIGEVFLKLLRKGEYAQAAFLVSGTQIEAPDFEPLVALLKKSTRNSLWKTQTGTVVDLTSADGGVASRDKPRVGDEASVTFLVGASDDWGLALWREETIRLRHEAVGEASVWRIVPDRLGALPEEMSSWDTAFRDGTRVSVIGRLAGYLASPNKARNWLLMRTDQHRLHDLARGAFLFTMDEETWPKKENVRDDLRPYAPDSLWTSIQEKATTTSFSYNTKLSGVKTGALKEAWQTVAFYDGKDEKLNFRHNGKALVAFADGDVKLIDEKVAKTLRWEP
ncbi:MAG TPA: hypothetical protein VF681_06755 [Abditibacteriaceae bacterium]|jgi:prepilin-type processing-associated H-X9-DG protein